MKEFIPAICYSSWNCKNPIHVKALNDMNFRGWRIFVPLGMLPAQIPVYSTSSQWRNYISNFVNNCPDGCWDWDNFSTNWWGSNPNQRFKDCLDFCKTNKWLPILNLCSSDETHGWIGLAPTSDKWAWLNKFCYEFALYLRVVYRFDRVDLSVINEPNEKGAVNDWYAPLVIAMSNGWKKACSGWKVHACGVDLSRQNFINDCLNNPEMMEAVDYISPHCNTIGEWNSRLMELTYENVKDKDKKFALLEMSPVSQSNNKPPLGYIPERMNRMIGKCDMYGIVLMIRNEAIGTSNDFDDIYMYNLNNPSELYCTSTAKRDWITGFNKTYYKKYEVEDDMQLDKIYEDGSRSIGVTFIQKVLNYDIDVDLEPKLKVDGWFGSKTAEAVKLYQKNFNLKEDGRVGEKTFKIMIFGNQNLFDELVYDYAIGKR